MPFGEDLFAGIDNRTGETGLKYSVSDPAYGSSISDLGIEIPRSPAGSIRGLSPKNWVWHHDQGAGVLQLVPKWRHPQYPGMFWDALHPGAGVGEWLCGGTKETMKLKEVIGSLKNIEVEEELSRRELPDVDFEQIDLYLVTDLNIESEVKFFDAESIPNRLEIEVDGIKYVNLFPLAMTQDMVESYAKASPSSDDRDIARQLLEYRLKDA